MGVKSVVTFCFASGTGNSARTVRLLSREFIAAGWESIQFEAYLTPEPARVMAMVPRLLVVVAPTLGFSAPDHFLKWLKQLPAGHGTPVALVAVCGGLWGRLGLIPGASGAVRRQLTAICRRKGYVVISATEHSMPVNWVQLSAPQGRTKEVLVRDAAEPQVRRLGQKLARGEGDAELRLGSPLWSVIAVVFRTVARRLLGKLYAADPRCNGCGWCATACPARAITLRQNVPFWDWNCDACNRCINGCPQQAIQVSWARLALHGGYHVLVTAGGVWLWVALGPLAGLGFYSVGLLLELFVLEPLLAGLQRHPRWQAWLSAGPTSRWGRYRGAP